MIRKIKRRAGKLLIIHSFTLSSSGLPTILSSAEYISAEKHWGASKCTDKLPSLVSTANHAGMLT